MYSINTNLSANSASLAMGRTSDSMNVVMQQLAGGKTAVDASTMDSNYALSLSFAVQSQGLSQAMANAQTGINFMNVMASSVKETTMLLQKMKVLSTQSQNAGYSESNRTQMNEEFNQLKAEIDRNANSAKFNGESIINSAGPGAAKSTAGVDISSGVDLSGGAHTFTVALDGGSAVTVTVAASNYTDSDSLLAAINAGIAATSLSGEVTATMDSSNKLLLTSTDKGTGASLGITAGTGNKLFSGDETVTGTAGTTAVLHVGYTSDATNDITVSAHNLTASGLGVSGIDITSVTNAGTASTALDAAITLVSNATSEFSAVSSRLDYTKENLGSIKQNTDKALASVQDTDYASATTELAKQRVLQQAASAMLTQANQEPQQAIQLLRG